MLRPNEGLLHICPYGNASTDDQFLLKTYLDNMAMIHKLNPESIQVRRATASDLDFVVAQASRMLDFGPLPWRDKWVMAQTDQRVLTTALLNPRDDTAFLMAETIEPNVQPLGFVHLTTHHDYFTGEAHGHMADIVVAKKAEGHGVGQMLMAAGEAWARQMGYRLLTLNVFADNVRARGVYEKAGFRIDTIKYLKPLTTADDT